MPSSTKPTVHRSPVDLRNRLLSLLKTALPLKSLAVFSASALALSSGLPAIGAEPSDADASLQYSVRMLALDANEGIAAGDVDGDGKTDLVAGRNWYRGGDWAPRPLRQIDDWNGYVQSNGDYLFDVNDDGRLDVIAGSFLPTEVHWYENPGDEALRLGKLWPQHLLIDTGASANEGQVMQDVDGDGVPEWIVNSWKKDVPAMVWRLERISDAEAKASTEKKAGKNASKSAAYKAVGHQLGEKGNGHGLAVGDINGDGKADVLMGQGWYEQPESNPWGQPWSFHRDWDLHSSLPMIVTDVDGDGDSDLIFGNGHDYGLLWWQNEGRDEGGKISWNEHKIDDSFSQPHTLAWVDLDGDGDSELVTGKRYFGHNGRDPGGMEMPCLYYYEWSDKTNEFTRQTIDEGHVGTGLQIVAEDLNGDGKVDLATAGKSGTHLMLAK